jgi:hypothetical protein
MFDQHYHETDKTSMSYDIVLKPVRIVAVNKLIGTKEITSQIDLPVNILQPLPLSIVFSYLLFLIACCGTFLGRSEVTRDRVTINDKIVIVNKVNKIIDKKFVVTRLGQKHMVFFKLPL